MNNNQIVNKRWKKTDETLIKYNKKFKEIFQEIKDELLMLYDLFSVSGKDLNTIVSSSLKRYINKKIKEWKEDGLVTGYLELVINSLKKYTYANVLEVLIFGLYYEKKKDAVATSNKIFRIVADDVYEQAKEDLKKPRYEDLTWSIIAPMLYIPAVNKTYKEYLEALFITDSQEALRLLINAIKSGKLNMNEMDKLLLKQTHRVININDTGTKIKWSGVLHDVCASLINQIYLFPSKDLKKQKVKFIATVDDRTTKMCLSLDGQEFYVNDWNEFYRYSESNGGNTKFKVYGLELGLNLPPITDNFHYCRSVINYL